MKIWVTGAGGVLATEVFRQALSLGHKAVATSHRDVSIESVGSVQGFVTNWQPELIINCAGRCPPAPAVELLESNALGPHVLSLFKIPLVHMSTDCVFSGQHGEANLNGKTRPDPVDSYGRSKLAGEVQADHVVVVRGSFISWNGGLLQWLVGQRGEIEGWRQAYWNGTSAARMAAALLFIGEGNYWGRTVHVAAKTIVRKFDLLQTLVEELRLPVQIRPVEKPRIWRVLRPDIEVPSVQRVLRELMEERKRKLRRTG